MINEYLENDNNLMLAIDLNEKEMREIVESKKWEDVDFSQKTKQGRFHPLGWNRNCLIYIYLIKKLNLSTYFAKIY